MKKSYQSNTIIGAALVLIALVYPEIENIITEQEIQVTADLILGIIGVATTVYGRIVAKDKIQLL